MKTEMLVVGIIIILLFSFVIYHDYKNITPDEMECVEDCKTMTGCYENQCNFDTFGSCMEMCYSGHINWEKIRRGRM
jgi:hypothetical protein